MKSRALVIIFRLAKLQWKSKSSADGAHWPSFTVLFAGWVLEMAFEDFQNLMPAWMAAQFRIRGLIIRLLFRLQIFEPKA
jgi:hypothetical protein